MVNMDLKSHYYIKEAAELTGLSEQLIRKWESRYRIIQPKRLDNGYRVYTMDDVLILKEIKEARDKGSSIKQAIQEALLQKDIQEKKNKVNRIEESPYVQKMIQKGKEYNEAAIFLLLKEANYTYGLALFLENTVEPFLRKIGVLWESGEWDESQETVSSLVVRDFLTEITRNFKNNANDPHVLGFCLPDEYHEIPLQIILLYLRMNGWKTTRIGASPKFSSIETLIKNMQPQMVVLSASTLLPFQNNENILQELDEMANRYPQISFHLGGKGAWTMTEIVKPKNIYVSYNLDDLIRN